MAVTLTVTLGAESYTAASLSQTLLNQIGQEAARLIRRDRPATIMLDGIDVDSDATACTFTSCTAA